MYTSDNDIFVPGYYHSKNVPKSGYTVMKCNSQTGIIMLSLGEN